MSVTRQTLVVEYDIEGEDPVLLLDGRRIRVGKVRAATFSGGSFTQFQVIGLCVDEHGSYVNLSGQFSVEAADLKDTPAWLQQLAVPPRSDPSPTVTEVITIFKSGMQHAPGRMAALQDSWPALREALENLLAEELL